MVAIAAVVVMVLAVVVAAAIVVVGVADQEFQELDVADAVSASVAGLFHREGIARRAVVEQGDHHKRETIYPSGEIESGARDKSGGADRSGSLGRLS